MSKGEGEDEDEDEDEGEDEDGGENGVCVSVTVRIVSSRALNSFALGNIQ